MRRCEIMDAFLAGAGIPDDPVFLAPAETVNGKRDRTLYLVAHACADTKENEMARQQGAHAIQMWQSLFSDEAIARAAGTAYSYLAAPQAAVRVIEALGIQIGLGKPEIVFGL